VKAVHAGQEIGAEVNFQRSDALRSRAHDLIPGGAHTYSKGDDQFPQLAPGFLVRGRGSRTWDLDGTEFIDWAMGLRSVILGHADPGVLDAIRRALDAGSNFTRPSPIEVEVAELLHAHIPSAEMVKFAKNGSDAVSGAVRLARAYTGRDLVARCAEQPFFAVHDWFIGDTECNAGVPEAVRALTKRFHYNDLDSLNVLFEENHGKIAAVVLEAASTDAPARGFLEGVRELCDRTGTVLIFDEIITGFRWHARGAQALFGVTPDLSAWSKGLANGFSISALCGRRDLMEIGGIRHNVDRVFLLSTTYGGETHHLAAARETATRVFAGGVVERIWQVGASLKEGLRGAAASAGIADHAQTAGFDCSPYQLFFDRDGRPSPELRTLYLQEMVKAGILIPAIAPSAAHTAEDIDRTVTAAHSAMLTVRKALDANSIAGLLVGPATKPVFRRRN
jgi:glutamate-1-semialdehyde 2,1-aminomutase